MGVDFTIILLLKSLNRVACEAGGAGNPSPAPAAPQEIKIIKDEPTAETSTASSPPVQGMSESPVPSSQKGIQTPLSLSEQVKRFSLTNRDNAVNDMQTDIFDFNGPANREETLNADELSHAAQVQVEGRSTAVDTHASTQGASLNRFRQQDVELGRVRPGRQE